MQIIKIGRSSRNDIVINDPFVSQLHCQIIYDDNGIFRLIDKNSRNGTYVNGKICYGETMLNATDIVRIGNTTIPWRQYFESSPKSKKTTSITDTCHKTINIGRDVMNDVQISDGSVSRSHCQLRQDASGITIVDCNSRNGTYVNGMRISGSTRLSWNDIVRIGNTKLNWHNYVDHGYADYSSTNIVDDYGNSTSIFNNAYSEPSTENKTSGLGIIALIISIAATAVLVYSAINIYKWGIFALIGDSFTYLIVAGVMHIIAYIIASIAYYNDHKDSTQASIARGISGTCVLAIIGFFVYLYFASKRSMDIM